MIEWKLKGRVYELELKRQPMNEIGTEMLMALEGFLDDIDTDKADALIMYSGVEGGFCAGADLRELYQGILNRSQEKRSMEMRAFIQRIHNVMNRLDMLPLTTIGVIHGSCFGGGFELALTCDILIGESTARFCFPELRLGIIPCFGGIPRLRRDVGNGVVRDLLLTGRSINVKRAQAIGLVSQVVPPGEGLVAARAVANQVEKFDAEARNSAKKFMKVLPVEALEMEKEIYLRLFQQETVVQALKKFVESDDVRPYLP